MTSPASELLRVEKIAELVKRSMQLLVRRGSSTVEFNKFNIYENRYGVCVYYDGKLVYRDDTNSSSCLIYDLDEALLALRRAMILDDLSSLGGPSSSSPDGLTDA